MLYIIRGTYRGQSEDIDTADTKGEAMYLRAEYALAYGRDWVITVHKAPACDGATCH